jgi:integrase
MRRRVPRTRFEFKHLSNLDIFCVRQLRLRWQDVDLQRGTLTVEASYAKNGETRSIPLSRALRDALAQLKQRAPSGSEFVFLSQHGTPFRSIRTAFTTACKHANLPAVSPHVLRHTFASRLAMAGVDIRTIQELGGWKEIKMIERYSHLSDEHPVEAAEKIGQNSTTVHDTHG